MERTEEQKELDKELLRECRGYYEDEDKPDGAYIEVNWRFFNLNKIKRLISAGADVNAKKKWGETPLYWAVRWDNIPLAEYLISVGADVNAKGEWGRSLLYPLLSNREAKIVKLLIKAGITE